MKKPLFRRLLLLVACVLLCIPAVFAQNQVTVKGKILDAEGQPGLRFVDHARDESGNELLCPRCESPVRVFSNRVVCQDEKCGWKMWRLIAGKPVTDKMLPVLLRGGTTGILKGFVAKSGKRFDASLRLNSNHELEFVFQRTLKQKKSW